MLHILLIVIPVILAGFLLLVATRPSEFRFARSLRIAAPPAAVFAQVNDLHKWEAWSPWLAMDPNAKNTYSGSPSGPGAGFAWEGNKVGAGRMTLAESQPDELIRIKLEFLRPFKAANTALFTFTPAGDQTDVTWAMSGKNNFLAKAFSVFVDCEKMCGNQFERGLATMKSIVEAEVRDRIPAPV